MGKPRRIFLLCSFVFILHFFFTTIYSFPKLAVNKLLQKATHVYMFPHFNQNWEVFAPEPPLCSKKLFFRVKFADGTFSKPIDPGFPLLMKHYRNRFWNYGKLFNIYEAIGREMLAKRFEIPEKYFLDAAGNYFPDKKIEYIECSYVFVYHERFGEKGKNAYFIKIGFAFGL